MKLYKTVFTYEVEFITEGKPDKELVERLRHNIDINIGRYDMVRTDGKLVVGTKEIEV